MKFKQQEFWKLRTFWHLCFWMFQSYPTWRCRQISDTTAFTVLNSGVLSRRETWRDILERVYQRVTKI